MNLLAALQFLGGIGLFLLGMRQMTDGLRIAAGNALRQVLIAATRSRTRAVASGVLITALVQSSSAVIFTTIGFVNAGLLSLGASVGVIFGSNVGTTLTSWVVALVGVNVKLQLFALPLVGVGALAWVLGQARRWGALGQAVAGLGLFFLGLEVLKGAFTEVALADTLFWRADAGFGAYGLALLLGVVLTILMQSSSAALAVVLTAAASGLLPLGGAAVMVIGANIGTTSTALFAIIGATPAAKRAALAHVSFNLITASLTLLMLKPLLAGIDWLMQTLGLGEHLATYLALFHTASNVLGLVVIWPWMASLVRWLERRFHVPAATSPLPLYLDRHIQMTPALALDALSQELEQMGLRCRGLARNALCSVRGSQPHFEADCQAEAMLNRAVAEYASGIYRQEHDRVLSLAVPAGLRSAQYNLFVVGHARAWRQGDDLFERYDEPWAVAMRALVGQAVEALKQLDHGEAVAGFEQRYDEVKQQLLTSASRSQLSAQHLADALERLSLLHRLMQDAEKAASDLHVFNQRRLEVSGDGAPP